MLHPAALLAVTLAASVPPAGQVVVPASPPIASARHAPPVLLCAMAHSMFEPSESAPDGTLPLHANREDWLARARRASGCHEAASGLARAALTASRGSSHSSSSGGGDATVGTAVPVCEVFETALAASADAGEWRAALELLDELESSGVVPATALYTEAARACRAGGEWARTISLLNRVRERQQVEGARGGGAVGLYSQVIGACDDAGQSAKMVELYALAVQEGVFRHWHDDEPFSMDLHRFSQATAVSAVRYVLQHELGNYLPADLKIITGRGAHTPHGKPAALLPRIERLLSVDLKPPLPYEKQTRLDCDGEGRHCRVVDNDGCLVVPVQELFRWLVDSRPFETYCINISQEPAT